MRKWTTREGMLAAALVITALLAAVAVYSLIGKRTQNTPGGASGVQAGTAASEPDKTLAVDAAKRLISCCQNRDEATYNSLFSPLQNGNLADRYWRNLVGFSFPPGETYELKTVEQVRCMPYQREWAPFPLTWVKISFPGDPNGLHILFLADEGQWKIVEMF